MHSGLTCVINLGSEGKHCPAVVHLYDDEKGALENTPFEDPIDQCHNYSSNVKRSTPRLKVPI